MIYIQYDFNFHFLPLIHFLTHDGLLGKNEILPTIRASLKTKKWAYLNDQSAYRKDQSEILLHPIRRNGRPI